MLRSASAFVLSFALAMPLAASGKHGHVEIKEWPIPWADSHPRDPRVQSSERVWYISESANYLASFNPQTQRFSKVDLTDEPAPRGLIVAAGANGMVWYTSSAHGYIGRYDPVSRTLARFPMPNDAANDLNHLAFEAGERNIWFTVKEGNIVGRLRLVNGIADLAGLSTPHALPAGVVMAPNAGNPWFALSGTNKVATLDVRTFKLTEQTLPRAGARVQRLAFTSDGRLWYVDTAEGFLGAFTPGSNAATAREWALPEGKASHANALAVDARDRLWTVTTGSKPNKLVSFDPKTERFDATPIPSGGGGNVPDLSFDRSSGALWFATDANTIGYANLN
jgi:virginiamycin B lyase